MSDPPLPRLRRGKQFFLFASAFPIVLSRFPCQAVVRLQRRLVIGKSFCYFPRFMQFLKEFVYNPNDPIRDLRLDHRRRMPPVDLQLMASSNRILRCISFQPLAHSITETTEAS
jgi:hypothetical protein